MNLFLFIILVHWVDVDILKYIDIFDPLRIILHVYFLKTGINYILSYISIENWYFTIFFFYFIVKQTYAETLRIGEFDSLNKNNYSFEW